MKRHHGYIALAIAVLAWGLGNIAQKTITDHLSPVSTIGLRCLVGGLCVLPLALRERHGVGRAEMSSLLLVSALFALAILLQQAAYMTASVTNCVFLVNTCVAMTPLVAWVLLGERPSAAVMAAATLAMAGAFFMTGGLSGPFQPGDGTALLSALAFAVWMVALGRHIMRWGRPIFSAAAQFLACAAVALPIGVAAEGLTLADIGAARDEILFLGVISTALAFTLQTFAQRIVPASHTALIGSAESVVAAVAAAVILGETASATTILGGALILAAGVLVGVFDRPPQVAPAHA